MKYQTIIVICLWIFLLVSLFCSIILLIELFKKGDERVKFILSKTCMNTVKLYVPFILVAFIYNTFFERFTNFSIRDIPVIYIGVFAIIFTITLFRNKKIHGASL